ncbi:unnamed protein product [Spirodela intermedia]|uniref:Methylthioribose-1-phosphate isomerase n=1 Tax=Spirodela intermedia TaxID=51605 RepID=A0A7I8IN64_SPIIN|nr:unnamed protein product [Spirodela intermedia]CAA6659305.1 unnamed protein product [Spirodela intermedia]
MAHQPSASASLQAIRYSPGSLWLLDQRKLPLETVYLEIRTAADGWSAIREMVVRGAPAIAISAALSLAAEASNLEFSGTTADSASFLVEKLEYLVSSRPTAVNLSEAATKLQNLVRKVAATASDPRTVLQAYIDAAEVMLIDDVAANKKLDLMGPLATAGYGTALGVIRALHAEGVLERAYCTETRPFNQGSRLTAYELVHDKIPATLIADSSAAALMKAGDTANKIGTYSLAVSASHHGIPFYVAAPFTSIDQSILSGDQIVIEERSPKELLHSRGGLGEQVAASGIAVWNPAFDVTPAVLIAAIITEKGVITRNSEGSFAIKEFLEAFESSSNPAG